MNAVRTAMKEQLNRDLPIVPFGQRQFITMSYTIFTFILRLLNQIQLVSTKHFQTKMAQPIKQDVAVVQKALIVFVVKLPVNYLIVMNHWPEFPQLGMDLVNKRGNFSHASEELQYLYGKIYHSLPPDTRTWKYNMNALQEVRPLINRFIDTYVQTYDEKPYKELVLLKETRGFMNGSMEQEQKKQNCLLLPIK